MKPLFLSPANNATRYAIVSPFRLSPFVVNSASIAVPVYRSGLLGIGDELDFFVLTLYVNRSQERSHSHGQEV
jgi:hypothetical protein